MNAGIYKLIWNDNSKTPVVVPETAKSHGKKSAGSAKAAASILSALTIFSLPLSGFGAPPGPTDLPTGDNVKSGNVAIEVNSAVMNITQSSQKAIINWNTFNIGSDATVNFIQPGPKSIALNRVVGNDPSQIFGHLNANGQVILINPNGVLFGAGSSVNVGGIVATTMNIVNKDFENGNDPWNFSTTPKGVNGYVINEGDITANKGGYIALMAPEVVNDGVLTANLGTVALASGDKVVLSMQGRDLIALQVDPSKLNTLIENRHIIVAKDGQVLMSASAVSAMEAAVIQDNLNPSQKFLEENGIVRIVNDGSVTANSVDITAAGNLTHEVFLGGNIQAAANVAVSSTGANEGDPSLASVIQLGNLRVGGDLIVSSVAGDIVEIDNKRIVVSGNANLSAGGSIDLGGDKNDFNTLQANAIGDVTIADRNGISITNVNTLGSLVVKANSNGVDTGEVALGSISATNLNLNSNGGNITQTVDTYIQVSGDVNLDARDSNLDAKRESGDIKISNLGNLLENTGNLLDGTVSLYGNNVELSAISGVQIKDAIIEGDFVLNALGSVTQSEPSAEPRSIIVAGKTLISSGEDIVLNNHENDFVGEVSLISTSSGIPDDYENIILPSVSIADKDSILFGNVKTVGNLDVYAVSGNIEQSEDSAIKVAGNTAILTDDQYDGHVALGNDSNDFNKLALNLINGDATVADINGITVSAEIYTGSLAIKANSKIDDDAGADGVILESVKIYDGNLAVASNGGDITKTDASEIYVSGSTVLNASTEDGEGSGDIDLTNNLETYAEGYSKVNLFGDVSLYGNNISLINGTKLVLASVDYEKPAAIEASGDVLLGTTNGDIHVKGLIKATSEEEQLVTLAAGMFDKTYRVAEENQPNNNVIFHNSETIEIGAEDSWHLYSDNPFTAGHLNSWVAENSNRRYNVAYATPASQFARTFNVGGNVGGAEHEEEGNFSYYRMQPMLKVNATSHQTVYGNKTKITYTIDEESYILGDTQDEVSGRLKYILVEGVGTTGNGRVSTTGYYVAGTHLAEFDYDLGLYSKLGYGFEQAGPVTVKINRRELSISGVEAASRYYNGNTNATLTGGELHGVLAEHHHDDDYAGPGDDVGIGAMSGQFESALSTGTYDNQNYNASKRYVASMQVALQGDDAQNYVVTTYDTRAPHQSKEGYKGDDTPVINPPVPGQPQPTRVSHQQDGDQNHDYQNGNESGGSHGGEGDHEGHDSKDLGDYGKKDNKGRGGDDDRGGKGRGGDDDRGAKGRDDDDKDRDDDDNYVPPGPIEAEIWEQPEPPQIPQFPPTRLEDIQEPRQAPVDLQSTLTESLYDESGTTSMTGDFTSVQPLGEYNISKGTGIEIEIPASTFKHSDPNAQLQYSAEMQDGSPMPEWLKFDAATRTLKGTPPDGQTGTAIVKIVVRDTNGGEATSSLTINY